MSICLIDVYNLSLQHIPSQKTKAYARNSKITHKTTLLEKIKKSEFTCPEKKVICTYFSSRETLLFHFNFHCSHLLTLEVDET